MSFRSDEDTWPTGFVGAVYEVLVRRIPPKTKSKHLHDIVDVLMEVLCKGELYLDITSYKPTLDLREPGWPESHVKALQISGWIDSDKSPIVLDGSQLGWKRWYQDMKLVVNELLDRSNTLPKLSSIASTVASKLPDELNDEQKQAVVSIDSHNLVLISGGPGTGKTSTIVQILARSITLQRELRVALCAPTGKAARRLQDSIQKAIRHLPQVKREELSSLPCVTLHRLLQAGTRGFQRNKGNPLSLDLLVVDEMSMVDLALMRALLNALPENCQLVLVGDQDQLPPVGSGSVWHTLYSEHLKNNFLHCSIQLQHVYRNKGDLEMMSRTLRGEGLVAFVEKSNALKNHSNFSFHNASLRNIPPFISQKIKAHNARLNEFSSELLKSISSYPKISTIEQPQSIEIADKIFNCLDDLMVLCPKRKGLWSVDHIHRLCLRGFPEVGINSWPEGFPVMSGENQPELGLANGDIGILIGENQDRRILFKLISEDGKLNLTLIHPARLHRLEPALALTIHKSQGSEAKEVVILWPSDLKEPRIDINQKRRLNELYEIRLLYTAITRAIERVDLITPS